MAVNRRLTIFAWSMYDFANTIFAMNVITLYFALWVTVDMHGEDVLYSYALSGSMLLAAVSAPFLGAISDRIGRRLPFLISFTVLCCLFTALIGLTHHLLIGLLYFAAANYFFQVADIFYNALLPTVSDGRSVGQVSGYGTGLGYCGTIVGLLLVSPFVLKWGRQAAFIPTACFFLLFALPCFIFVKDDFARVRERFSGTFWKVIGHAVVKIKNTVSHIHAYPGLFTFLIAIFISFNAINTIFIFMSVYTKKVMQFADTTILVFYLVSSVFAIMGALLAGFVTDKLGPKKTLSFVLIIWSVVVLAAAWSYSPILFWIIGPVVGVSLGATWTSARALVVHLSPPDMVGEIFGFYGLMGKTASIVGPLIWGGSVWALSDLGVLKYRIALMILWLFLIIGLLVLQRVPNTLRGAK